MSGLVASPSLEYLERSVELIHAELERLLDRARENERARQDIEAETDEPGRNVRYITAAYDQRRIARMLSRGHAMLVHPSDDRYPGAERVLGYLRDAELADGPWRPSGALVELDEERRAA